MSIGLAAERKQSLMQQFRVHDKDTGSPEVQVAILTNRIADLTNHLRTHRKDNHTRLGLIKMVGKRKRLLRYLQRRNRERYLTLIAELGIRG